jgi:3',5'-nucleoside bisphosphate phosphatase
MNHLVDLHTHTHYSDGALSPRDLVALAKNLGMRAMSITDHDNIDGVSEISSVAAEVGVEIIAGVELSATLGAKDIHILGYMFDPDNKNLRAILDLFKKERMIRAEKIVKRLNRFDLPLRFDTVLEYAGHGAVGRPHIAAALVDEGLIETYEKAFDDYIGDSRPAFEPKYKISPADAMEIIANAGGISILAHPGYYINDYDLSDLIRAGLDGIEVVHPAHDAERVKHYRGITSTYFLLESGGSDFHGGKRNDEINFGAYTVGYEIVEAMKRRLFIH